MTKLLDIVQNFVKAIEVDINIVATKKQDSKISRTAVYVESDDVVIAEYFNNSNTLLMTQVYAVTSGASTGTVAVMTELNTPPHVKIVENWEVPTNEFFNEVTNSGPKLVKNTKEHYIQGVAIIEGLASLSAMFDTRIMPELEAIVEKSMDVQAKAYRGTSVCAAINTLTCSWSIVYRQAEYFETRIGFDGEGFVLEQIVCGACVSNITLGTQADYSNILKTLGTLDISTKPSIWLNELQTP